MVLRQLAWMGFLWSALLTMPAVAQTDPVAWLPNIEAAKNEARETGRLVLVHFWTEDCAPCVALDRNVFSQPEVANAIKQQFVTVKLNANANPATASSMGVTRVPTDVVITPDGQVVGKLISPSTPMAYVAELSQVAAVFKAQAGQAYASATASPTQPSQLNTMNQFAGGQPGRVQTAGITPQQQVNSVYAGLNLNGTSGPVAGATNAPAGQPPRESLYSTSSPFAAQQSPQTIGQTPASGNLAAASQATSGMPVQSAAPSMIDNRYTQMNPAAPATGGQFVNNQYAAAAAPPASAAGQATVGASAMGQPPIPSATTATSAASARPDPSRLPAGSPPLGFEGYCPVSMRTEWRWVAGNPQFGVIHRGRSYWFASEAQKQQFFANPDLYSPALSGIDPVLAVDHRQQVPGRREHSVDYDNLFYMFSSEASLQQFTANPERYAASVRAAMGIQPGRTVR